MSSKRRTTYLRKSRVKVGVSVRVGVGVRVRVAVRVRVTVRVPEHGALEAVEGAAQIAW